MTISMFLSDSHLGKHLRTNTTEASRGRLKKALFNTTIGWAKGHQGDGPVFHCADLYDRGHNSEEIIMQGLQVSKHLAALVSGNHDARNIKEATTSFDITAANFSGVVASPFWEPAYPVELWYDLSVRVDAIPHCVSQAVFDESIALASKQDVSAKGKILILHCNYENPFADERDQDLNITAAQVDALLEVYDLIISGHEHQYCSRHNGRFINVGSQHPTSFNDISDKYAVLVDHEVLKESSNPADAVSLQLTWDVSSYCQCDVMETLAAHEAPLPHGLQFIRLTGELPAERASEVADLVSNLWQSMPNLIAVKQSDITYISTHTESEGDTSDLESLPDTIRSELDHEGMKELFDEALKSVQGES